MYVGSEGRLWRPLSSQLPQSFQWVRGLESRRVQGIYVRIYMYVHTLQCCCSWLKFALLLCCTYEGTHSKKINVKFFMQTDFYGWWWLLNLMGPSLIVGGLASKSFGQLSVQLFERTSILRKIDLYNFGKLPWVSVAKYENSWSRCGSAV
jgi:hypothetical protein